MSRITDAGCWICRFMRALSFSAIGAAVLGYGALWLGADKNSAILAAFFGALGLVLLMTRKQKNR